MDRSCVGQLDSEDFSIRAQLLAKLLIDECEATGLSHNAIKVAFARAVTHLTADMEQEKENWNKSFVGIEQRDKWENAKILFAKAELAFDQILRRRMDGSEVVKQN